MILRAFNTVILLASLLSSGTSQCTHDFISEHMSDITSDIDQDMMDAMATADQRKTAGTLIYTIPTVVHVFHDGEWGKLEPEQIYSGIQVLNDDFNGLNADYQDVEAPFDAIRASIDIDFCLATIDPDGNPTTGITYTDDPSLVYNSQNLYAYGWDNSRYLNIYLPIYVFDSLSNFTAFATFPSTVAVSQGRDGIHYSSVRFGYGKDSQLEPGQEWASVITHELGHWLGLRHTFQGGCADADGIDDTPPTLGGTIYLSGCDNNDFSCGVTTNGSNYMDYNHDCKRMFTRDQVDLMLAVLDGPVRAPLYTEANLRSTGCWGGVSVTEYGNTTLPKLYPNPSQGTMHLNREADLIVVSDLTGQVVYRSRSTRTLSIERSGLFIAQIWVGGVQYVQRIAITD